MLIINPGGSGVPEEPVYVIVKTMVLREIIADFLTGLKVQKDQDFMYCKHFFLKGSVELKNLNLS